MKKIYIIGNLPSTINKNHIESFYKVQLKLLKLGFEVINPILRLTNNEISYEEAKKKNINDLMSSNAVYIMPCIDSNTGKGNIELKIAYDLNLLIVSGFLEI